MANLGCAYNTEIGEALWFASAEDLAQRKDLRIWPHVDEKQTRALGSYQSVAKRCVSLLQLSAGLQGQYGLLMSTLGAWAFK